eukprot:Opistho-2@9372
MNTQLGAALAIDFVGLGGDKENYNPLVDTQQALTTSVPARKPTLSVDRAHKEHHQQPWDLIRALDDDEKWAERVQIVTKQDHIIHLAMAEEVVRDVIEDVVAHADDGAATPTEEAIAGEATDDAAGHEFGEEEHFATPSKAMSQLEFDYFDKLGAGGSASTNNARLRESLYTRFDPLLSDAPQAASQPQPHPPANAAPPSSRVGANRTPPLAKKRLEAIPQSPADTHGDDNTLIVLTPARPTAPRHAEAPAMTPLRASGVAARAVAVAGDVEGSPLVAMLKYSEKDMTLAKKTVKEESEKEIESLRAQVKALTEHTTVDGEKNKNLTKILDDYESVMTSMLAEMEAEKATHAAALQTALRDKEQALGEFRSVETAFSDLHRRYEKLKETNDSLKKNEDILKQALSATQQDLVTFEQRYNALKRHAEDKLEMANQEIERVRAGHSTELAVVSARLKKSEIAIAGLERTLAQKEQENKELVTICDELIAKVK